MHHDLITNHTDVIRRCLIGTDFTIRLVLESCTSPLEPIDVVVGKTILHAPLQVVEGTWASWSTHLVVHESLANIFVAAKSYIPRDGRLILNETAAEVLLPSLRAQHLLLLLLLCKVELVDTTMTILRGQC